MKEKIERKITNKEIDMLNAYEVETYIHAMQEYTQKGYYTALDIANTKYFFENLYKLINNLNLRKK